MIYIKAYSLYSPFPTICEYFPLFQLQKVQQQLNNHSMKQKIAMAENIDYPVGHLRAWLTVAGSFLLSFFSSGVVGLPWYYILKLY